MTTIETTAKTLNSQAKRGFPAYMTTRELKEKLRAGAYSWPGYYPIFFITSDGAALSFDSVKDNLRLVLWSIKNKVNDGWRVVASDVNWEDGELTCDHSGKRIESAYAG
jgi:hypothetical protein